jgi:hypothetical protein
MSAQDLIEVASRHGRWLLIYFLALPLLAWLVGVAHRRVAVGSSPWRYLYMVLVYLAAGPGMAAAVLLGYTLFFTGQNLLQVDLVVYALPLLSLAATLAIMRRRVDFVEIPGFQRLSGLMVMIAASFVLALGIAKTRIWLLFGSSLLSLLLLVAVLFGLIKWGVAALLGQADRPSTG